MRGDEEHNQETMPPASLSETFNLPGVVSGLLTDLEGLRAGRVSVKQARAAAELGRVAIMGMKVMLQAQRLLIDTAKKVPATQEPAPARPQIEGSTDG